MWAEVGELCSTIRDIFFCVRAGYKIQLVRCSSNHSSQFLLISHSCMLTHMHNLTTTCYIWTFSISNNCSTIGHILCMIWSCKRDPTGELWPQTCIGHSLIQTWCAYTANSYIHHYLVHNYAWQAKFTYLITAYYAPNDSFTANDAVFYIRTKLAGFPPSPTTLSPPPEILKFSMVLVKLGIININITANINNINNNIININITTRVGAKYIGTYT